MSAFPPLSAPDAMRRIQSPRPQPVADRRHGWYADVETARDLLDVTPLLRLAGALHDLFKQ
jgi:hypothetical protein